MSPVLFSPIPKKKSTRKKILIFQEIELFTYILKKFREQKPRKKILKLQQTKTIKKLLIFQETEPFSAPQKIVYISGNGNPENNLYISGCGNPEKIIILSETELSYF